MGSQILLLLAACLLCANICQALTDNLIYDENKNFTFKAGQVYQGVKLKDRIVFTGQGPYEVHKEFKIKKLPNAPNCLGFFDHNKVIVLDCPARNVSKNGCSAVFNKTEWNSNQDIHPIEQLCPVDNLYETCKGIVTPDQWNLLFNCHFLTLYPDNGVEPFMEEFYPIQSNGGNLKQNKRKPNQAKVNSNPLSIKNRITTTTTKRPYYTGNKNNRRVTIRILRSFRRSGIRIG